MKDCASGPDAGRMSIRGTEATVAAGPGSLVKANLIVMMLRRVG